jgi:hypothetical protein
MENSFVDLKLRAASAELRLAQGELDAAILADGAGALKLDAMKSVSGKLSGAQLNMDEIGRHLLADVEAAPQMRDCPACGSAIRAQATLCGYCWKKQ